MITGPVLPRRDYCRSFLPDWTFAMTPGALSAMAHWAALPSFRHLTVGAAQQQLQEILPRYPQPADQPLAICVNGYRWFGSEMEALADAIHRAARRPHLHYVSLSGEDWAAEQNREGLWALPSRCSPRSQNERVAGILSAATAARVADPLLG
jgi:hypothetical protein